MSTPRLVCMTAHTLKDNELVCVQMLGTTQIGLEQSNCENSPPVILKVNIRIFRSFGRDYDLLYIAWCV